MAPVWGPFFIMTCTNPIRLGEGFVVPCGKCMACRVKRTQEWATRLLHESTYYKENTFLTLTYNDEYLPGDMSLRKEEVQLFMKRLRKRIEPDLIKFYAAGEYGEENKRPHYHFILFGIGLKKKDVMEKAWSKGFIYVEEVNAMTCRYVTAYVQKKLSGPMARKEYGDKQPPFQLASRGLGKRWAVDNLEYLNKYKGITVKGKRVGIPRYYTKVVDIELGKLPQFYADGMIDDQANNDALARREFMDEKMPELEQWKLVRAKRAQDELTLLQKVDRKKRK